MVTLIKIPPRGYFRFSKYVHSPSDLSAWADWFCGRGIPCFVEKRTISHRRPNENLRRGFCFALWRKGRERLGADTKSKDEKPTGEIIWQGLDR